MPKAFILAAPFSGSGKTLTACGLLSLLREKGFSVAAFKIGPDYIDPGHLQRAAGSPCYNLDSWMLGKEGLRQTFARGMKGKEIGVIEGVMGLYDGVGGGLTASTAEVAEILSLPVVLVFSARGLSGTIAALAKGLSSFRPLKVLGVVVTGVASPRHERLLRRPLEEAGFRVFGLLPRKEGLRLPSRHLGLVEAREWPKEFREELLRVFSENFDLKALLSALPEITPPPFSRPTSKERATIALARDAAFSFYYQENLERLEEAGAKIIPFSPLKDSLPRAQGYYFGGGYPELYLDLLSSRTDLWTALHRRLAQGAVIFAECGGFMALSQGVEKDGTFYPLAGLIKTKINFSGRLMALGYREVFAQAENFLLPPGLSVKGHEFRYSTAKDPLCRGFFVRDAEGKPVSTSGLVEKNLFASYVHLHFGSQPKLAQALVEAAAQVKI